MKKRIFIFSVLLLLTLATTAVALAANRPARFDFSQLEAGAPCPICHNGVICLVDGDEDRADELCEVSGYHHVITVQTMDWACTGCGLHFVHAAKVPSSFFCAYDCPEAQKWEQTYGNH